jgi:hypothetical protein
VHSNRTPSVAALVVFLLGIITLSSLGPVVLARAPHRTLEVPSRAAKTPDKETASRVRAASARLPLRFEPTPGRGVADSEFIARGAGYSLAVAKGEARLDKLTMRLVGASGTAAGRGRGLLPGITNYLIGNDPRRWRKSVRSYAEVEYRGVYAGVDVIYYGNQQELEFDFIVAPGASYRAIALSFEGSTSLKIDGTGNLLVSTAAGTLVQHAPVIYQNRSGGRSTVDGAYVLRHDGTVGFHVPSYDPSLPLVIDPVLTYSTYLGASREERAGGIGFDAQGNMYVAGTTGSQEFPITGSPADVHGRENWDAFVLKLNPTGEQFLYATYVGGSGYEQPAGLAVDEAGNAYVAGQTDSWDFPTLNAIQSARRGISDGFVTKLDSNGAVVYSTYLGGNNEDRVSGIAVDALGRTHVTGSTISGDFPTANALQPSLGGHPAFRTTDGGHTWAGIGTGLLATSVRSFTIDPANSGTVYAGTYSDGVFKSTDGGSTWTATGTDFPPYPVNGMAVDSRGAVFGATDAGLFRSLDGGASWALLPLWMPVSALAIDSASQTLYAGAPDWYPRGVFSSVDAGETWTDTGLPFGTPVTSLAVSQSVIYAGTSNGVLKNAGGGWEPASADINEAVTSVAVDPVNPNVVYAGTNSALFLTTSGGTLWSSTLPYPVYNVVVAPSNPSIVYVATWYGSGMTENGGLSAPVWGIDWQATGPANTNLGVFAIDPLDPRRVYGGGTVSWDSFVSRISADGSHLEYSTFIGGSSSESETDIALDPSGAAYVAGTTQSSDFPVLNPFQANAGGLMDVFVAKISEAGSLVYSTYLGGWGSDYSPRIAVDGSGQAHVVGITLSANFPTANAFQPVHGGGFYDVFVTTLNAAGKALVYSTYLGGNDQELWSQTGGPAIAIGPSGDAFVTGSTASRNFPARDAIQSTYGGGLSDAFVANFDTSGGLVYSTYFGGSGADYGARVAVDAEGEVAIAGATSSTDFWTHHAIQRANAGAEDVFIARIGRGAPPADATPPSTSVRLSGTAGLDGWFKSSLTVTLDAADDEDGTGVASVEYSVNGGTWQRYAGPFVVATQGATSLRARSTDRAGNAESPGAASTFRIDSIAPAITLSSPASVEYLHTASVQASFAGTDAMSGLSSVAAMLDGVAVANGQTIELLTLALGTHILTVSASDRAGNTASWGVGFTVVATIDTLIHAVNSFIAKEQIDAPSGRGLLAKLNDAKQALGRGNLNAARSKLTEFRNQLSAQRGHGIATAVAELLITDADYVIGTLR